MSSIMRIFARKENVFVPLFEASCGELFDAISDRVPYGKIRRLNYADIEGIIEDVEEQITVLNGVIEREKRVVESVKAMNDSFETKLGAIQESENYIDEMRQTIKEKEKAVVELNFIEEFVVDAEGAERWYGMTGMGIYAGVDCGIDVEEKDVAE